MDPNANRYVYALAISADGSTVYVGGDFSSAYGTPTIGGQTRNYIAAIETSTSNATSWDPNANADVYALAVSGSTVYVGGYFTSDYGTPTIGNSTRNRIAAIDASTGNATSWDPHANDAIYALAVSGSIVYVGGDFTTLGSGDGTVTRNRIAAIDADGTITGWNPNANSGVLALAVSADGSTVYAGGDFNVDWYGSPSIGGVDRNCIAALNASDGSVTNWNPIANDEVLALAISGSTVYAGGYFTNIGGQTRNRIVALDANTNTNNATSWNPNANSDVYAIALSLTNKKVYVAGSFSSIDDGANINNFAGMDNPGDAALPVELTSFTANAIDGKITLSWKTSTEVNNYGFDIEREVSSQKSVINSHSSIVNSQWEKIGFVKGSGNSNSPKEYSFVDLNPSQGKIQYRLKQIDNEGSFIYTQVVEAELNFIPKEYSLSQNYPNPFNPATTINYQLPANNFVTLKVYDVLGREVTTLVNGQQNAGVYKVSFDGAKYSSGVYMYKIDAVANDGKKFTSIKKLVLLK